MSLVTCHVYFIFIFFVWTKLGSLLVEGLVPMGPIQFITRHVRPANHTSRWLAGGGSVTVAVGVTDR